LFGVLCHLVFGDADDEAVDVVLVDEVGELMEDIRGGNGAEGFGQGSGGESEAGVNATVIETEIIHKAHDTSLNKKTN